MSRSAESEAPIAFSCSSRSIRSPSEPSTPAAGRWILEVSAKRLTQGVPGLLDADRADFLDVRRTREAFLHAVLLQSTHAVLEALRQHLSDARVLLDELLQLVGGNQELVQAAASLETRAAAFVAADRLVEGELALVIAVVLDPVLVDRLHGAIRVSLEARGAHQLLAVLAQERRELRYLR